MHQLIDCFLPCSTQEENAHNTLNLKQDIVNKTTLLQTSTMESATWHTIAAQATAPYTLVYLNRQFIQLGYLALERMVTVAEMTGAGMVYADHYKLTADGHRVEQDPPSTINRVACAMTSTSAVWSSCVLLR